MHACGHDSHTAILMGAAEVLAQRRGDIAGSVMFLFQPAEEAALPGRAQRRRADARGRRLRRSRSRRGLRAPHDAAAENRPFHDPRGADHGERGQPHPHRPRPRNARLTTLGRNRSHRGGRPDGERGPEHREPADKPRSRSRGHHLRPHPRRHARERHLGRSPPRGHHPLVRPENARRHPGAIEAHRRRRRRKLRYGGGARDPRRQSRHGQRPRARPPHAADARGGRRARTESSSPSSSSRPRTSRTSR